MLHPLGFIRSLIPQWERPFSSLFAGGCASDARLLPQQFSKFIQQSNRMHIHVVVVRSPQQGSICAHLQPVIRITNAAPRSVCLSQELSPRVLKRRRPRLMLVLLHILSLEEIFFEDWNMETLRICNRSVILRKFGSTCSKTLNPNSAWRRHCL